MVSATFSYFQDWHFCAIRIPNAKGSSRRGQSNDAAYSNKAALRDFHPYPITGFECSESLAVPFTAASADKTVFHSIVP